MDATKSEERNELAEGRDWGVFWNSLFFVLGFSVVFSIVGVLLQTALSHSTASVEAWLGRAGGAVIILFGLFLLGLIKPRFLMRDHKMAVRRRFGSRFATSFVFGAAFAVGWTPCVSAALGAILALAATQAGSAFVLLMAYTIGLGLPFLLVGFFAARAQGVVDRLAASRWLAWLEHAFGALLVVFGVYIFAGQLSRFADFQALAGLLDHLGAGTSAGADISSLTLVNFGIAALAGLVSFLSPCILPIIPGFLSYLAATAVSGKKGGRWSGRH